MTRRFIASIAAVAITASSSASTANAFKVDKRGKIAKHVSKVVPASGTSDSVHKLEGEVLNREGAVANDLSATVDRLAASGQNRASVTATAAKEAADRAAFFKSQQTRAVEVSKPVVEDAKPEAEVTHSSVTITPAMPVPVPAAPAVVPAIVKAEVTAADTDARPPTGVPNPSRKKKNDIVKTGGVVSSVTAETGGKGSLKNTFGSGSEAKKDTPEEQKWDMIKEYRAEKCAEREDPLNHADCMKFMEEICNPGGNDGKEGENVQMNGEKGENGSGKGLCSAFYTNVETQKKKEAGGGEEEKKEEAKSEAEPEEEPAPAAEEEKEEPKELSDAVKDSDSSGTGPAGMDRRVLGRKRMHRDGKTQVGGWRNEYGPGVADTYGTACAEHPYNHWCLQQGYTFSIFYSPIWYIIVGIIIGVSGFTLYTVYTKPV